MNVLGVVITYKETKLCEEAIKSLANAGVDVALIFNGWSDEYSKWLEKVEKYVDFKFLNKENVGFCRGNNMAMKLAIREGYDYVFLLNNDAYIESDCIDELVKAVKDERVGMAQPKVYKAWNKKVLDTTGHIFKYGDRYSWEKGFGGVVDRGEFEEDFGQYDDKRDILGCCGCSVLYKVKMLKEIGLFWEKLWSIGEDAELSWRAHKHGWKAKFVPEAVAYHWRGYTGRNKNVNTKIKKLWEALFYRNWVHILRKHGNFKQIKLTSAVWFYTGCKSWIGQRIGRNDIGGYFVWLAGLALMIDHFLVKMEKEFEDMFKKLIYY